MEGTVATDAEIREAIQHTSSSRLDEAIAEFIHDRRNQEIARKKILENVRYEPLSEEYGLSPGQVKNIIRKARRTIFEHLN